MPIDRVSGLWTGPSKSEAYLSGRSEIPKVSSQMVKGISDYRRGVLSQEVEQGLFRDGSSPPNNNALTPNSHATASVGMKKTAQILSGGGFGGAGGTVKQIPEVYSPLWLTSNLNLPRDRATINAWCRSFYALNPFVANAISLHSTYPISKLSIKCPNKEIENFFNDMIEETDLLNICVQIAQEYWLLGESFPYGEYDEIQGKWSRFVIYNPDYMIVKRSISASEPEMFLRPDENLKKIVTSTRPSDIMQKKQLNQHIIDSVRRGENIPLDNFNVWHLARRISPYEIRGTGLPVSIFRILMLFDQMYEAKFAQAQNLINPITVVKIGTDGPEGLHPTHADLEAWRELFETAQFDRDFKIFTHAGVAIERIGASSAIIDINPDIQQIIKMIYIGLMVPQVIMESGDITYANGGIALDVLRQRYIGFRNMLAMWLRRKIFAPICEVQGFFNYENGKKRLIVPEVEWNHMSLFDTMDYISVMKELASGEDAAKRASLHSLYKCIGLDYEDEVRKMKKEAIQNAIALKEKAALQALDLNSLRALSDTDEIPAPSADAQNAPTEPGQEPPVPGQSTGMPSLDLSSPPPMPSGGMSAPETPPTAPPAAPPATPPAIP
jgi:hypothetical protein